MPGRLRERFKAVAPTSAGDAEPELTVEDFGYDEEAPAKYSTNLRCRIGSDLGPVVEEVGAGDDLGQHAIKQN